jgi:hypothetical protein
MAGEQTYRPVGVSSKNPKGAFMRAVNIYGRTQSDLCLSVKHKGPTESCKRFELRKEHNIHMITYDRHPSKVALRENRP